MHGQLREIEWLAQFAKRHPRAKPPISVPQLAKLCHEWYPKRYRTVVEFAVAEFTCIGEEDSFRWKYVNMEWMLDHMLGVDYLYRDENGNLIALDVTLDKNRVASKCSKHFSLRGIFSHLGITPFVVVIGNECEEDDLDVNPVEDGFTNY